MHAILALSLLFAATLERCDACSSDNDAVELCAPHAEAERLAIEEHGPVLLDDDPERARAALQALAAQTANHENAPSAALARALTRGLEHPSYGVSSEVLRLLQEGQDPGVTREVLLESADGYRKRARAITKLQEEMQKQAESSKPPDGDDLREALKHMSEQAEQLTQVALEVAAFQDYTEQLLRGLDHSEDECVDAILKVADGISQEGMYAVPVVTALARSGRRDALERAVRLLDDWEEALDDLEDREKDERKRKLEKKPRTYMGSDEAWEQRAQESKDKRVQMAQARVEMKLEHGREMHAALAELVRARDLGEPPEWSERLHSNWRTWLRRHRGELPVRLDPAPADD